MRGRSCAATHLRAPTLATIAATGFDDAVGPTSSIREVVRGRGWNVGRSPLPLERNHVWPPVVGRMAYCDSASDAGQCGVVRRSVPMRRCAGRRTFSRRRNRAERSPPRASRSPSQARSPRAARVPDRVSPRRGGRWTPLSPPACCSVRPRAACRSRGHGPDGEARERVEPESAPLIPVPGDPGRQLHDSSCGESTHPTSAALDGSTPARLRCTPEPPGRR